MDNLNVLGIVAEYNPFHNGHKFHIEASKKASGASHTVCVMSGSLVQRGDFSVFNKWERARAAILNGVDLVIELPAFYVLQSAENFCFGAVKLLDSLGVVNKLSFGSENSDISLLENVSHIINGSNKAYNESFKKLIGEGESYPVSRAKALKETGGFDEKILSPNNLLGIYYLLALQKLKSKIEPITIKRHMTLHNIKEQSENFATASYIREKILSGNNTDSISHFVPEDYSDCDIFSLKNIEQYMLGFFSFSENIVSPPGAEEGMMAHIVSCAKSSDTLEEFFEKCTTKRYTLSRIKRVCLSSMLSIRKEEKELDYIRVLAFNDKGRELIRVINSLSELPVVVKTADFKPNENSMFKYDVKATDLAYFSKNQKVFGADYKTSPVIFN